MEGHGQAGPLEIASQSVIAAQEQDGPTRWQVLGERETWDGHAVIHAGYDREQECQEPT
jgi:hypothetical protein